MMRCLATASVSCPTCSQWHFYWVYIEWHKDGFFCELPNATFPRPKRLIDIMPQIAQSPTSAFARLCPSERKQEIKDVPH